MDKESVLQEAKRLIDVYNKHKNDNTFASNEKQICETLIKPFIHRVLGWNIEDFSEFKVEYPERGKRIDYLVCLEGISQFVIEAKSLTKELIDNREFYSQAINYAHSKEKTFAILTNFRYWIILRCDITVPFPERACIGIIDFDDFDQSKFDELIWNFNKDEWIAKGQQNSLYSKLNLQKKIPIDKQLLEDMKRWRESALTNIKKHQKEENLQFSDELFILEVEEEIQRFIDRLIFVCYCEDKEINEPKLKSLKIDKAERYHGKPFLLDEIHKLFEKFRQEYDSDLFEKGMCDNFNFDDTVLYDMIEDLREPKGKMSYNFATIDADILGRTYENFIGHITTGKKRFKEEKSMSKRKAEGIYYTPQYIVNYIVNQTVREHVKNKSFEEIKKVRIVDPACGSGSFLIKIFDVLIEESYKKLKRELFYEEKESLLLNCIYGVDLDARACEIAKFNLSLKLAKAGKKLPRLHNNIVNGNSLIDDEEISGRYAFKWEEKFKEIINEGGFDIVVGNPPYVRQEELKEIKPYLEKHYETYVGTADLYVYFFERGIANLKHKGKFSFIVSNKFARSGYGEKLRKYLLEKTKLIQYIDKFDGKVFEEATVDPCIIILEKTEAKNNELVYNYNTHIKQNSLSSKSWGFGDEATQLMKNKIEQKGTLLKEWDIFIYRGITTGFNEAFIIDETTYKELIKKDKKSRDILKPILKGEDILRYYFQSNKLYCIYSYTDINIKEYSAVYEHLEKYKNRLGNVWEAKNGKKKWYELRGCKYYQEFEKPKIIWSDISDKPCFTYDTQKYFLNNTTFMIPTENKYILGLLNSKLIFFYFTQISSKLGEKGYRFLPQYVEQLPIFKSRNNISDKISSLVDQMLDLQKKFNAQNISAHEKERIEQQVKNLDNEIDQEVYTLYDITKDEQKIIEDSLK